ncbi:uncharacterized protein si:dkey-250k15.4 isoform X2 [Synchiropus splendidus]|nr:uncharacterized protein si:dkey-250k15.4 isoform X2 [Synchiropus splendidus]XP_053736766.1 uncharacterized protein si:dkey-250k15.4 isoform X2 [Synchiropus splendidus]
MSHALITKDKFFSVFNRHIPTKHKRSAGHKCSSCSGDTHAPTKTKRLKTRKERSMRRCNGADRPNIKFHHHDSHRSSQDVFHNCCHSKCHCSSQKEFCCAAQEPSIITSKRLVGRHRGFNHEVKSIDIERFLTDQIRMGKGGQKEARKGDTSAHSSCCPSVPVTDRPASDDDELLLFGKKPDLTKESHDDSQENIKEIPNSSHQARDQTPQQKIEQSADKHKTNEKNRHSLLVFENSKDSQVSPPSLNEVAATQKMNVSPPETLLKVTSTSVQEVKSKHLSSRQKNPSLTMSSGGKNSKMSGTQNSKALAESIRAAVRRLCGPHYFPLLKRRDLEAESKATLMKALRERHGPDLHKNLKQVQRCSKLNVEYVLSVQNPSQAPAARDEHELQSTDPFSTQVLGGPISQSLFGSQGNTKFKMNRKKQHNWKSGSKSSKTTTDWLPRPEETSGHLFEDLFEEGSPPFDMNFDPPTCSTNDHLFSTSFNWGSKTCECDDLDVWPEVPKMSQFNFFDGPFMNNTESPTGGRSRVHPINMHPTSSLCHYSSQPNHTHLKPIFPYSNPFFAASFNDPRSGFRQNSAHSFLSSPRSHMSKFPPSPRFEKVSSPLTSLSSPDPWPFPPMRLY